MSYHPGRMGLAEGTALVFIILFPRVFLTAPANMVTIAASAGWWVDILAAIPAIIAVLIIRYVYQYVQGDIVNVAERLFGRMGAWLFSILGIIVFFTNAAILLRQFAENTLLTALPQIEFSFIVGWYAVVVALAAWFGLETLARGTYLLMPMSIFSLLAVLLLLVPYYDIYNLTPWVGKGILPSLKQTVLTAGINTGGLILMVVAPALQNLRTFTWASIFGIVSSVSIKGLSIMVFTMVFGVNGATEKILPFFEMARLVYLSRYVQRIESLFIILWVVVGVLGIAISIYMGTYFITRMLLLPTMRPLIPLSAYLIAQLAMMPPDIATVIRLDSLFVVTVFNAGLYLMPTAMLLAVLWHKRKGRAHSCSTG